MADPRARESISDLVREAIQDAKEWFRAEIALIRAQIFEALGEYATAAIAWVVAAIFALLALIYLGLALVLLLRPYLGDAGAAFVVGLALLIIAAGAFLYGRAKFLSAKIVPPRISQTLSDSSGPERGAEP
jgi:hypothetical protein